MKTLRIHIDRVVVEGLSAAEQRHFRIALEQELHQLAQSGIAESYKGNTRRRIGSLQAGVLQPGSRGAKAAAQVTASIRSALGGAAKSPAGAPTGGGGGHNHV